MKYEFIETYRSKYAVRKMCRILKVHEGGYYRWKNKIKTTRELEDERYVELIRKIHESSRGTYGATRIRAVLLEEGITCSLGRIRRLMRENGIYSLTRYKHRP